MNRRDLGFLVGGFIVGTITGLAFREKREMKEISPKEFFDMAKKNGGEASVTMKFKPAESAQAPQHQYPVTPVTPPPMSPQFNQDAKMIDYLRRKRDNGEKLTQYESNILDVADNKYNMLDMTIVDLKTRLANNHIFLSQGETALYRQLKEQKEHGEELSDIEEKIFELLSKFVQLEPGNA